MDNLARTIGPAPSELSTEEVMVKIGGERKRVNSAILQWREENIPKKRKAKKTTTRKKKAKQVDNVAKALAEIGMDRDKMYEFLLKREEEKKKK